MSVNYRLMLIHLLAPFDPDSDADFVISREIDLFASALSLHLHLSCVGTEYS